MFETAIMLMMNSLLLMLRISPGESFLKPLSREKEAEYIDRWQKGDIEARNLLVEHNMRLVTHIIKKYYQNDDVEDLISIGSIGLIKGINTYKPDKGVRLATYASRCIENEILMHFRSSKKSAGDISLSETLDMYGEGEGLYLIDVVSQEDDMAERVGGKEMCMKLRDIIKESLDERESRIIMLRYGLCGGEALTQRETARYCGISRSYV